LVAGRKPLHTLAFAVLCAAIVAVGAVAFAGAAQVKVLGKTERTPKPDCPKNCSAIGSVTGFQLKAAGEKQPFKAHRDGKVVAWAIRLSRPNKEQRNFFGNLFKNDKFGEDPSARIAVIRRKEGHNYKLLRQSPPANLKDNLGDRTTFTLNQPLRIRKGDLLALTVPTWASSFASGLPSRNQWRGSRERGECSSSLADARASRPHQKAGSVRDYDCDFAHARLLYWGYYVPD
jgi:hypothetical protein